MRHDVLYAEDECDEWWARLARAVGPYEQRLVRFNEGAVARRARKGDWRGDHLVAYRVRVGEDACA